MLRDEVSERFDIKADLVLLKALPVIGSIKRDTDLLIEYTLMRIDLQRFRMFGRKLNRKLLIAEPLRVDPIFFILILIAFNACLHPIMGKLLDLVVSLHFIRYNDYIL